MSGQTGGRRVAMILSGGMDSAVLLAFLRAQGADVLAISIEYGQRHTRELESAMRLCRRYGVEQRVVPFPAFASIVPGSSQTDLRVDVPVGRYDEPNMKTTVVPNRNMMLLAIGGAAAIAAGCDSLAYGAHAGDHTIYPDCRPEFVESMARAFALCDWHTLRLDAPFVNMTKGEICALGVRLAVPFGDTWSCYVGADRPCGKCGACTERAEAFAYAGAIDPLIAAV